jgi:glycosyltransferase involved in cell wall biosynthesis
MSTQTQVRVSYLIITRNRAEFLQRTLNNVREFITPEDELIVIDGGSTDETVEILERNRDIVSFYLSEPDKGEAHAFNKGAFRAKGKYIKPITDDDYFYPEAMHRMVEVMESDPEIEVLMAGGEKFQIFGDEIKFTGYNFIPPGVLPSSWEGYRTFSGLGLIIRKEVIPRTGGVSGNYVSVDGDLVARFIECGCNYKYIDICAFKWHNYPHSGIRKEKEFYQDRKMLHMRFGGVGFVLKYLSVHDDRDFLEALNMTGESEGVKATMRLLLRQMKTTSVIGNIVSPIMILLNKIACTVSLINAAFRRVCLPAPRYEVQEFPNSPIVPRKWSGEIW